jgi:hypothetical protein
MRSMAEHDENQPTMYFAFHHKDEPEFINVRAVSVRPYRHLIGTILRAMFGPRPGLAIEITLSRTVAAKIAARYAVEAAKQDDPDAAAFFKMDAAQLDALLLDEHAGVADVTQAPHYDKEHPRPCSFPNCNCCPENCIGEFGPCCFDCRYLDRNRESRDEEDKRALG